MSDALLLGCGGLVAGFILGVCVSIVASALRYRK